MVTAEDLVKLLSSAFGKTTDSNTYKIAGASTDELEILRQTLGDVLQAHGIETASGTNLDNIAGMLAVRREDGETDAALRAKVGIDLNRRRANGTVADIKSVTEYVSGVEITDISVIERPAGEATASFYLVLHEANPQPLHKLFDGVERVRAAGVVYLRNRLTLYTTVPPTIAGIEPSTVVIPVVVIVVLVASPYGWGLMQWGTDRWGGTLYTIAGIPSCTVIAI